MQEINRRQLGFGVAAVSAAGLLGRDAEAAIPEANVPMPNLPIEKGASLRVLRPAKFVAPDETIFNENTKAFTAKTGVEVKVDYSGWEDLRPQTAVTANTGAGPDIVVGWTDDPHLYSNKLVDLTDIATYLGKKYGGWYPLAEKYGKKDGTEEWIAIPMGASGGLALYRKSWCGEVGYDELPKEMDKFLDLCRKLQKAGHPAGFALGHAVGDANAYAHWLVWSHGGTMTDPKGKVTINSKETVEALKYGKALYETFIPGTKLVERHEQQQGLVGGAVECHAERRLVVLRGEEQHRQGHRGDRQGLVSCAYAGWSVGAR